MERNEVGMITKKRRIDSGVTGDIPNHEGEVSSKVVETQSLAAKFVDDDVVYRLYFKGLVSNEVAAADGGGSTVRAGFGVAICDQTDKLLFDLKEPVSDAGIDRKEVEIRALIRGLGESLDLGIRNVAIYCEDDQIYQNIIGSCDPKEKGVVQLMEEVGRLREKFASSEANLVALNDIKFAFELAREAIVSQTSSANGDGRDDNNDDNGDSDGHDDDEDDNPWAYGCGCDCGFDSPLVPDYVDYYSL